MYSSPHSFYTSDAWRVAKAQLINERGIRCERCGKTVVNPTWLIPHHIHELTPANVNDPSIALSPDNLELLCFQCHNEEHHRVMGQPQEVYVVWGAPRAGKSTYVADMAWPDDLVVDVDKMWDALCPAGRDGKPNRLIDVVMQTQRSVLDMVAMRRGHWQRAWVVGCYRYASERDRMIDRLGAESIFIQAKKDECLSRCSNEQQKQWVSDWFSANPEDGTPPTRDQVVQGGTAPGYLIRAKTQKSDSDLAK